MRVQFEPQPDITTWELAQIYNRLTFGINRPLASGELVLKKDAWAQVEEPLKRHFKVTRDT